MCALHGYFLLHNGWMGFWGGGVWWVRVPMMGVREDESKKGGGGSEGMCDMFSERKSHRHYELRLGNQCVGGIDI